MCHGRLGITVLHFDKRLLVGCVEVPSSHLGAGRRRVRHSRNWSEASRAITVAGRRTRAMCWPQFVHWSQERWDVCPSQSTVATCSGSLIVDKNLNNIQYLQHFFFVAKAATEKLALYHLQKWCLMIPAFTLTLGRSSCCAAKQLDSVNSQLYTRFMPVAHPTSQYLLEFI